MPTVLILYASTHGHTAKVTDFLAQTIHGEGLAVEVHEISEPEEVELARYDAVIVAASVHRGRHQEGLVDWVRHHQFALAAKPSAFLSVSLTAAEDTEEAREATQGCIDDFLDDSGWTPTRYRAVAGALQYREYDVFTRVLMRLMMRRGGHPTDISHDYEYTDWDAVERFGREFAGLVQREA